MVMDIWGAGGELHFSSQGWAKLLELAHSHGWEPAGTLEPTWPYDEPPPEDLKPWDGTYFSNDYQKVTAEDASHLAEALEKALQEIPEEDAPGTLELTLDPSEIPGHQQAIASSLAITQSLLGAEQFADAMIQIPGQELSPLAFWSGPEGRQRVEEFIALCKAGAFVIG